MTTLRLLVLAVPLALISARQDGRGSSFYRPPPPPPPSQQQQQRNWEKEASALFEEQDFGARDHDDYFEDTETYNSNRNSGPPSNTGRRDGQQQQQQQQQLHYQQQYPQQYQDQQPQQRGTQRGGYQQTNRNTPHSQSSKQQDEFQFDLPTSDFFAAEAEDFHVTEEKEYRVSSAASRARDSMKNAQSPSYDVGEMSYEESTDEMMQDTSQKRKQDKHKGLLGGEEKHVLYDAYNELHTLAQGFDKSFDSPAVVVVGHQSSGKSALIEALMGFQFSEVGGGTKTRRPVALRMQYNPECNEPRWYLLGDDGVERPMELSDIQEYIERENRRLELDPMRSFDSREINMRMEYKNCPNMILIDTPGLISAPRVPKGAAGSKAVSQQRALQASAKEAEKLVIEKMSCEDYIILCVEDTSDWKHGQTREVVLRADPELARTVIVNTKFDTKLPQFGSPTDVLDFLRANIVDRMSPNKLGGPFFTSVPSGRVGRAHDDHSVNDFLFDNDDDFVDALSSAEKTDLHNVAQKIKKRGNLDPDLARRIGITHLRKFLELKVEERYKRNVQKILPMLKADRSSAERRLKQIDSELKSLSMDTLRAGAEGFCDEFCKCLRKAMKGSIVAPVEAFGETLSQEYSHAGSFFTVKGSPMAVSDRTYERLVEAEVGNGGLRLYGGSQYHRVLREFHLATTCLRLPSITEDEIANAAGIGETHDGVNFLHAACVIAIEKARLSFEPMMTALETRMTHVMDRLCPVTEYMLRKKAERESNDIKPLSGNEVEEMDVSQNPEFRQLIQSIFEKFVRQNARAAMSRCRDDLTAITKYVTWNLNERGSGALGRSLPDQADLISVYRVALESSKQANDSPSNKRGKKDKQNANSAAVEEEQILTPIPRKNSEQEYRNLLQLMEENFVKRDEKRTNLVVGGLVQHIVTQWRMQFCNSVISKFNCYFMMPFTDEFHKFVRLELQRLYDGDGDDLSEVFDIKSARLALEESRHKLAQECELTKSLQEKFRKYSQMMNQV